MNKPIAVFDAGLGSYAIVEAIKKAYPQQDIIYFADRKSFPYGAKTVEQLKTIIKNSIDFLSEKGASFIVLASNAPSITVLDKIKILYFMDKFFLLLICWDILKIKFDCEIIQKNKAEFFN